MLDNKNQNSPCHYAEQLVSFLYGEIEETEKMRFKSHLQDCAFCSGEIAGFASVRSSLQEWRMEDFASLATPVYEQPFTEKQSAVSANWLASIRAYFAFPQMAGTLVAALTILLIFGGLFWFIGNAPKNNEFAADKSESINKPVASPAPENFDNDSTLASTSKKFEEAGSAPRVYDKQEKKRDLEKTAAVPVKDVAVVKNSPAADVKKSVSANSGKNNLKITAKSSNKAKVPALPIEEDEDDSLRLSDIFEEVGSR